MDAQQMTEEHGQLPLLRYHRDHPLGQCASNTATVTITVTNSPPPPDG